VSTRSAASKESTRVAESKTSKKPTGPKELTESKTSKEFKKPKEVAKTTEAVKRPRKEVAKTIRELIVEFYTEHNPAKLSDIDRLLEKYRGREEGMYHAICEKYDVEPKPLSDPGAAAAPGARPASDVSHGAQCAESEAPVLPSSDREPKRGSRGFSKSAASKDYTGAASQQREETGISLRPRAGTAPGTSKVRSKDWTCPKCGNFNWAIRGFCNKKAPAHSAAYVSSAVPPPPPTLGATASPH